MGVSLPLMERKLRDARVHRRFGLLGRRVVRLGPRARLDAGQVAAEGVGDHEVAVGQALHERRGAQAVGAVIGEVRFAQHEQAWDGAHEVVVHPEPAHGVVGGRVDAHGGLVRVLTGDAIVHLEEIAVLLLDLLGAEALGGFGEVQVDPEPRAAHAPAIVADLLGGAAGDVAGGQVAVRGVFALQVVVPLLLGNLVRRALVALLQGHPDAAVVAQALGHEGELALVVPGDGDAGGVDLGVAGVAEGGPLLVGPPDGAGVAALGVGGQVHHVAVAARGQDHRIAQVGLDLAGHHVPGDDALGHAVHQDQLLHLVAGEHLHLAQADLPLQGLVGAQQQLLARLAPGVEGAAHLGAAEGAVVQEPAVFPGEGHALGHALVDDVVAHLGQTVDVGLPGPEVAALHGVVEEAEDAVAVVVVVLGGVDAALGGDGVGPARAVLVAEAVRRHSPAPPGRRQRRLPPGRSPR